jgi:type III secretion protein C
MHEPRMKRLWARVRLRMTQGVGWRQAMICLGLWTASAVAGTPPWPASAYSYFAQGTRLETVLAEFAAGFNLSLSIQPDVSGTVTGRFTTATPTEFLSRMGGMYGFAWYTHAGVLHVSKASDMVTRSLPIPGGGLTQVRATLTELGVVDPRFGWGELPDHGILMVSGPASYVSLVEESLKQLSVGGGGGRQVRVFRLQHASAIDRPITYRDQTIVQRGLASVLRLTLAAGGADSVVGERAPDAPGAIAASGMAAAPLLGASGALTPSPSPPPSSERAAPRPRTSGRSSGPSIQADPRLNAILVSDVPEMMPVYERLIAQLDVPSALIEIEAMIIDINTDRAREMGINWSLTSSGFSASFNGSTLQIGTNGAGSGTLPVDAGTQLLAQIRLLETRGDARIQSRPSVLTTDNVGAILDLSETFYIRVQGERTATVSPVTAGTTLKVTPRLMAGANPSIQLTVDIEDGQIQDRQIDSLPTVRRSTVSTQAVVRQSETLMIAGYSSDQNIENEQKVPVLGDLPVLGALFANKSRTVQKRERLFLIRPKLVAAAPAVVTPLPDPAER